MFHQGPGTPRPLAAQVSVDQQSAISGSLALDTGWNFRRTGPPQAGDQTADQAVVKGRNRADHGRSGLGGKMQLGQGRTEAEGQDVFQRAATAES